ncbi:hypothetical protein GCM10018966_003400 [Streptomyces yanii]
MGGSCQRTWDHAIPKSARASGPRISLQFRPDGGCAEPAPPVHRFGHPARRSGDPAGADVTWGSTKSRTLSASSDLHVHRARPVPASSAPADRGGKRT